MPYRHTFFCLLLIGLSACRTTPGPNPTPVMPGEFCPGIQQPVCGVDGRTYPNSCEAQKAGVASTPGECDDITIQPI